MRISLRVKGYTRYCERNSNILSIGIVGIEYTAIIEDRINIGYSRKRVTRNYVRINKDCDESLMLHVRDLDGLQVYPLKETSKNEVKEFFASLFDWKPEFDFDIEALTDKEYDRSQNHVSRAHVLRDGSRKETQMQTIFY